MAEVAAGAMRVEICAPEREPRVLEATEIIAPGLEGQFTVLADHTPFLSVLTAGVLTVCDADEREHLFAVNGGFVEVNQNQVVVLGHLSAFNSANASNTLPDIVNATSTL